MQLIITQQDRKLTLNLTMQNGLRVAIVEPNLTKDIILCEKEVKLIKEYINGLNL